MNYNFRLANKSDLSSIIKITNDAKKFLKEAGSKQWNSSSGYPNEIDFTIDIDNENLYVLELNNNIIGFEALIIGNEKSYETIDGAWQILSNNYMTIHRIAIKKEYRSKHVSKELIRNAYKIAKDLNINIIRGDTHKLNIPMQKLFVSEGFKLCGTITLLDTFEDNLRLAYEKIL